MNDLQSARDMYRKAIEDGDFIDRQFVVDDEVSAWKAQCEIGSTYVQQGDDAQALEWFERGLSNRPAIQPLRLNRASALERLNRPAEAEAAFRSLYEDFGDELSAVNLVNYLLRHKKEREAVALIDRTASALSKETAVSMLLAAAYVCRQNGWPDGERFVVEACRIAPDSQDAARALDALEKNRGEAGERFERMSQAFAAKRYEDALETACEGVRLHPGDGRFGYYAALACANLDRKEEALRHLDAITDPAVGDGPWFLRAAILRETGNPAQALEAIERVLQAGALNVDAVLVKASLLESLDRSSEAETLLCSALGVGKQRVAVELASLYLRLGRLDEAKRVAESALA